MSDLDLTDRASIVAGIKSYIEENGSTVFYGGWTKGESIPEELAGHDEQMHPWEDFITAYDVLEPMTDWDNQDGNDRLLAFMLEPIPTWWLSPPKSTSFGNHPTGIYFKTDSSANPLQVFSFRDLLKRPISKLEYWSSPVVGKPGSGKFNEGTYQGVGFVDEGGKSKEQLAFDMNKANIDAMDHDSLFDSFVTNLQKKTPDKYTDQDWQFLELVQINRDMKQDVGGYSAGDSPWTSGKSDDVSLGGGGLKGVEGYIVYRLLTDPKKQANPFDEARLSLTEAMAFADSSGNVYTGYKAYDQAAFYAATLEHLTTDTLRVWDDTKPAPLGSATATPEKVAGLGIRIKGPGEDPANAASRAISESYNTFKGFVEPQYGAGDGEKMYSNKSALTKTFYDWLVPQNYGQKTDDARTKGLKSAMVSFWEGARSGAIGANLLNRDFDLLNEHKDFKLQDLSKYDTANFVDWNKAVNTPVATSIAVENKEHAKAWYYLPKSVEVKGGDAQGRYTHKFNQFTNTLKRISWRKDILSFNNEAALKGGAADDGMTRVKADSETGQKNLDKIVELFNSYTGGSSEGIKAGDDQKYLTVAEGTAGQAGRLLTTDWFKTQFKNGLIPNSASMLNVKINLLTTSDGVPESTRALLAELLPGVTEVQFTHEREAWKTVSKYAATEVDGGYKIETLPLDDIMNRYYLMSYYMYVTSRIHVISDIDKGLSTQTTSLLSSDFMGWYASRAAFHYRRIWETIMQSHYTANLYSLLVLVASISTEKELSQEALNALEDLIEGAVEAAVEALGTAPLPDSTVSKEAGLSEASKEARERFYKQCALMLNMHKLAEGNIVDESNFHNKSYEAGYTSYNGRVHLVKNRGGENTNIINKLISPTPKQMKEFTDISTQNASKLMPFIKIFKVYNHDSAGQGLEGNLELVEIPFPIYNSDLGHDRALGLAEREDVTTTRSELGKLGITDDYLNYGSSDGFRRGAGVGIKEFSWEYDGETPATASKYIKAKLHLHFQNFNEFIRPYNNQDGKKFSYVDLFVSPTNISAKGDMSYNAPHHLKYEPDYYRIRVDVGYHESSQNSGNLNKAIAAQNSSFYLVLVDHEIEINEDMTVDITANYRAYIEEAVDSQKFNALNSPEVKKLRARHMAEWDKAIKDRDADRCSVEELNKVRSLINSQMANLVKKQHKSIMTNLLKEDRIFFVDFDTPEIDNFRQNGFFGSIPTFKSVSFKEGGLTSDAKRHLEGVATDSEPFSEHYSPDLGLRVYYFYLGDLMYLLMSNLYTGEKPWVSSGIIEDEARAEPGAERTKMLLMDFDYENILSTEQLRHTINIADIPISVDYFFEWYVDNIIKNEVTQMPIGTFVRKILTELITEAMAEVCITGVEGHYVTFQYASFVAAPENLNGDVYIDPISAALFLNKNDLDLAAASKGSEYTEEEIAAGIEGVNESATESTIESDPLDDPLGESIEVPPPEPSPEEERYETAAYESFDLDQNAFRFDVNEFYGTPSLPLPRVPAKDAKNQANSQYNYIMIYGDFSDPYHTGEGDQEQDEAKGTYHFNLARDRGLLKNISFSKNNIPYHRESRMFNQGQAGNLQLSAVYDCNIKMIGNTLFLPGMEIYINPYGFAGEDFGNPYDKPLIRSPDATAIRKYNANHADSMSIGTAGEGFSANDGQADQSVAELEYLSNERDQLDAGRVNAEKIKSPIKVNSYANLMGIGGYQLITGIQCSIAPGKYETTIKAKHTYTGYPQIQQSQKLTDFRADKAELADADSGTDNACKAILKRQEVDFLG